MNEKPAVTVAIVTYNSSQVVGDCLGALAAGFDDISYEVVIADNASSDETLRVIQDLAPDATLVAMETNRGYAAGVNAAIAAGRGSDAVLILNPDVRLQPGALRPLLAALALPSTGIAVPKILTDEGTLALSLRRQPTVLRTVGEAVLGGRRAARLPMFGEVVGTPESYEAPGIYDWATGAAMLISTACLAAIGPWDESFFLYSEETEYALRARDAGFSLRYTPEARIVHLGGDLIEDPRLWSMATVNRVGLYRRRHGPLSSAAFTAGVALHEALRALKGSRTHRAGLRALMFPATRPPELASQRAGRAPTTFPNAVLPGKDRRP